MFTLISTLAIIGAVTSIVFFSIIAASVMEWVLELVSRANSKKYEAGKEAEKQRIISAASWFNEKPETTQLINDLVNDEMSVYAARQAYYDARNKY